MKTYLSIIMLTILLTCSGCLEGWWQKPKPPYIPPTHDAPKDIVTAQKTVKGSAETIKEATGSINREVATINKEAELTADNIPDEARTETDRHLIKIEESSAKIAEDANEINTEANRLVGATNLLEVAKSKAKDNENSMKILVKERDKALEREAEAIKAKNSALQRALRWLVVASIVGAAALGVFGFMYQSKISLTLSAVCIAIMSVAIFVQTYFIYIIIFGGIVLLGLVGIIGYNIWVQRKANKELVDTVEVTKDNLSSNVKEKLFGGEGQTGIMDGIQSKTTMEIVKREKDKLANLWTYAKDKLSGDKKEDNKE